MIATPYGKVMAQGCIQLGKIIPGGGFLLAEMLSAQKNNPQRWISSSRDASASGK